MKTFSYCPKCKDTLMSDIRPTRNGGEYWTKQCMNKVDHSVFAASTVNDSDELDHLTISVVANPYIFAHWSFSNRTFRIDRFNDKIGLQLPFFEPDLSDYDKLLNKIKNYIVLS